MPSKIPEPLQDLAIIWNYPPYQQALRKHTFPKAYLFHRFKMQFGSNVTSLLARLEVNPSVRQEAGQYLSYFDQLSYEEQNPALESTIEKVFPLVFAKEAAVQNTARYQELHQKPWQVISTQNMKFYSAAHFLTDKPGPRTAIFLQKSLSLLPLRNK
jgi:hypothetical protein